MFVVIQTAGSISKYRQPQCICTIYKPCASPSIKSGTPYLLAFITSFHNTIPQRSRRDVMSFPKIGNAVIKIATQHLKIAPSTSLSAFLMWPMPKIAQSGYLWNNLCRRHPPTGLPPSWPTRAAQPG